MVSDRESYSTALPSPAWRECFNSAMSAVLNGASLTAVTIINGVSNFNGTSSKVEYLKKYYGGIKSVRIRLTLTGTTHGVLTLTSTHRITITAGTIAATGFSTPTIYVDGVATNMITAGRHEIVVTTATGINVNLLTVGWDGTSYYSGSIDLTELQKLQLNSLQVKALYNNSYYKDYTYALGPMQIDNPSNYYGISFDITATSPDCTRTGNMLWHKNLPIQSNMKACLLNDDGTVNYYLNPDDWSKKAGGGVSKLDGTDGQVMIEIPTHWYRTILAGNTYEYRMSPVPVIGYTRVPRFYYAAYEGVVNRTGMIKIWSIVNNAAEYRGGNNNAAYDLADNTFLGRPATLISRTNFRTYANNRSAYWTLQTGEMYSAVVWLYTVEYATRNSQKEVDNTLTAEGYRKGGLGAGITTAISAEWNTFNGYYPFAPCGASNSLNSRTGEVDYIATNFGGAGVNRTFKVPRYRGIENPFGHVWKWLDGINIRHNNAAEGANSLIYQRNVKPFTDNTATNYTFAGYLPMAAGYVKLMQKSGLIMPLTIGAGTGTWWCDYFYTPQPTIVTSGWFAPIVGGRASYGASAGFGYVDSIIGASDSGTYVGGRLSCVS